MRSTCSLQYPPDRSITRPWVWYAELLKKPVFLPFAFQPGEISRRR